MTTVNIVLDAVGTGGNSNELDTSLEAVNGRPYELVAIGVPIVFLEPPIECAGIHIVAVQVLSAVVEDHRDRGQSTTDGADSL